MSNSLGRDWDADLFDPEAEFDNSNAMLDAAVYHGPEGTSRVPGAAARDVEKRAVRTAGVHPRRWDQVIVPMRLVTVGRDEIETSARSTVLFTLSDGKVTRMKAFQSKAEALEAAGLSE